ncbi:MAG TPA: hypothetical protein VLC06_12360 [Polyangia bacterium]|nr:hypothetical protein [Polyangia bacterium]
MGRSNVIIVGSVVLAPLVLGIESYALYRAHHRRTRTTESAGSTEMTAPPIAEAPRVPVPAEGSLDQLAPPPPAAAAAEAPPPETETVSDVQPDPSVERQGQLALQHKGEILQAADEQVFGALNVPDAQRTAIRAIDSAYAHQLQAIGQLPPGTDLPSAGLDPSAARTRRAAIADVLGADAARAFAFAERRAERRVRSQFRAQQVPGR